MLPTHIPPDFIPSLVLIFTWVCSCHWGTDSLKLATSKEKWIFLLQHPNANSSSVRGGASMASSPAMLEILIGLILFRCCAGNYSCCEFVCRSHAMSKGCLFIAFLLILQLLFSFHCHLLTSKMCGKVNIDIPSMAAHSLSHSLRTLNSYESLY